MEIKQILEIISLVVAGGFGVKLFDFIFRGFTLKSDIRAKNVDVDSKEASVSSQQLNNANAILNMYKGSLQDLRNVYSQQKEQWEETKVQLEEDLNQAAYRSEESKKKHETIIKNLEKQIVESTAIYEKQIKSLKERCRLLEEENEKLRNINRELQATIDYHKSTRCKYFVDNKCTKK